MKTFTPSLRSFFLVCATGVAGLAAPSCAAANHASHAATHSGRASGHAVAASAESATGSLQVVSGVAAVPVWMSGAVTASAGAASAAVGEVALKSGNAVTKGADKMWDFATGETAPRPPLARQRALPPAAKNTVQKDPPPGVALKAN